MEEFLQNKTAEIVYKNAIRQITGIQFLLTFLLPSGQNPQKTV